MSAISIVLTADFDVVSSYGGQKVKGPYAVHIEADQQCLCRPLLSVGSRCLGVLVANGLVEDDSLCERIKMAWTDSVPGRPGPVRVWLIATGEEDA